VARNCYGLFSNESTPCGATLLFPSAGQSLSEGTSLVKGAARAQPLGAQQLAQQQLTERLAAGKVSNPVTLANIAGIASRKVRYSKLIQEREARRAAEEGKPAPSPVQQLVADLPLERYRWACTFIGLFIQRDQLLSLLASQEHEEWVASNEALQASAANGLAWWEQVRDAPDEQLPSLDALKDEIRTLSRELEERQPQPDRDIAPSLHRPLAAIPE
jgi:hypothetical protein